MMRKRLSLLFILFLVATTAAQKDPGPRTDTPGAGGPLTTLNAAEQEMFNTALEHFKEINSVNGKIDGEESVGLGPTFNGNSCAMCHVQPAIGGTSPAVNPQIAVATLNGATNKIPSFIKIDGPVREARFTIDGGVHGLFTIAGRSDASGCNLQQPDFAAHLAKNEVVFRIPTPVFGLGLVEATPGGALWDNLHANAAAKTALGIRGHMNVSGNDGTATRFGWKAQNKSLLIFSAEAYNVEQGITNEAFPNERAAVPECDYNGLEDPDPTDGTLADMPNFAIFMRLSAPPVPAIPQGVTQASVKSGSDLFTRVGCALCHTPTLTTGKSSITGVSNLDFHPFSDFALHRMGVGLRDNIKQGTAGVDEFRTAPLWGIGQRLFFLHDGRTSDLLQAISAHGSDGSEATKVINNFKALNKSQVQDVLNFLRSL
jgi:CxxC motif-containing protein (DUF1111 family)